MNRKKIRKCNYMINEINAIYHGIALRMGISDSAQSILYTICENGESCMQSEIYKQTGISRQTISTAIRRLEKDGFVYLKQGQGRNTIVCLTENGKIFADEKSRPLLRMEEKIFYSWTDDELDIYLKLMERYRNGLKAKMEEL